MAYKTAAVVGSSDTLGKPIIAALAAAGVSVTVLTRSVWTPPFPAGVTAVHVDYDNKRTLAEALQGIDLLVLAIGSNFDTLTPKLVDAAIEAGVKRILPSEYGGDTTTSPGKDNPVFGQKVKALEYIKTKANEGKITYTAIMTGPFLEFGFRTGFLGFDIKNKKATLYDNGANPTTLTSTVTIGKAVAGLAAKPDDTKNKVIRIGDATITQRQILERLEKISGQKYEIINLNTAEVYKKSGEALAKGDYSWPTLGGLMAGTTFSKISNSRFEKTDNALVGLPSSSASWTEILEKEAYAISPSLAPLKNIVLVGATGTLGAPVAAHLASSSKFNVTALTRASSTATFPKGVTGVPVDYNDHASLVAALKGKDALVITIGAEFDTLTAKLVDAAIEAGVRRIIPSEFGGDTTTSPGKENPVFGQKVTALNYIKEKATAGQITYTAIMTGPFLEFGLSTGFLGFDLKGKKATLYDDGVHPFTFSTLPTIAKAIANILSNPANTTNKVIRIGDATVTQRQLLKQLEKHQGQYEIKQVKTDELYKSSKESLGKGDYSWPVLGGLMAATNFSKPSAAHFPKLDNALVGLPAGGEHKLLVDEQLSSAHSVKLNKGGSIKKIWKAIRN